MGGFVCRIGFFFRGGGEGRGGGRGCYTANFLQGCGVLVLHISGGVEFLAKLLCGKAEPLLLSGNAGSLPPTGFLHKRQRGSELSGRFPEGLGLLLGISAGRIFWGQTKYGSVSARILSVLRAVPLIWT